MPDETPQQDYYPKELDPWLINLMGSWMYSQLVGDEYEKHHSGEKIFKYKEVILTKDNAKNIITQMFLEATWETIAEPTGKLKLNVYNGDDLVAYVDGVEYFRSPKGDLMVSYDVVNSS